MYGIASAQVYSLNFPQIGHHTGSVADQRHLQVEQERANIHVARADHRDVIVDGDVLGVQQDRVLVPVELDAGFEEIFVVGALSVAHQELVTCLRVDQGHIHSTLGSLVNAVIKASSGMK